MKLKDTLGSEIGTLVSDLELFKFDKLELGGANQKTWKTQPPSPLPPSLEFRGGGVAPL